MYPRSGTLHWHRTLRSTNERRSDTPVKELRDPPASSKTTSQPAEERSAHSAPSTTGGKRTMQGKGPSTTGINGHDNDRQKNVPARPGTVNHRRQTVTRPTPTVNYGGIQPCTARDRQLRGHTALHGQGPSTTGVFGHDTDRQLRRQTDRARPRTVNYGDVSPCYLLSATQEPGQARQD
jgi:hypothetical protein